MGSRSRHVRLGHRARPRTAVTAERFILAEVIGEHVVEAVSGRVPSTLAHRDDLWGRCYAELMDAAQARLAQEVTRLGGDCAHVLRETVDTRHDEARGEMWLRGQFTYVLYRLPKAA